MRKDTIVTLDRIDQRLDNIEKALMSLLDVFENITSSKSLTEEITELKKEVAKLSEERSIFNKK